MSSYISSCSHSLQTPADIFYHQPMESMENLQQKIRDGKERKVITAAYDHLAPLLQETIRQAMEHLSENEINRKFAEKAIHMEKGEYFQLFEEAVLNVIEKALPPQIQALQELDSLASLIRAGEETEIILDFYSSLSVRAEINIAASIHDELALEEDLSSLRNVGQLRMFAKNRILEREDIKLLEKATELQILNYISGWHLSRSKIDSERATQASNEAPPK